ncbi:MAG: hypothetical protein MI725_12840 [Pirellulales bacterium]|nr:hypothetical protein [Pirellulales bacterium]
MAISTRTDQRHVAGPAWTRQPILLAQLPRVGAAVKSRTKPPLTSTPGAVSATASTQPNAETVSLRVELPAARASRSVEEPSAAPRQQAMPVARVSSSPLLQLHARLAPHAGLIVALALIASAGLLYWLIVGPTQIPLDYYDMGPEGIGQTTVEWPAQTATTAWPADASFSPGLLSVPSPRTTLEIESPKIPDFPETSRSSRLDFSRIGEVLKKPPQAAALATDQEKETHEPIAKVSQRAPESLPIVAELPGSESAKSHLKR